MTPPAPARRTRAPRRDAVRNRERILAAAREVVAERGMDARMAEVARRAGVGVGTLYRAVPTKQELFAAILTEEAGRLAETVQRALDEPDAATAFRGWMAEIAELLAAHRAYLAVLAMRDHDGGLPRLLSGRLRRLLRELTTRAKAAGALRDDAQLSDVLMVLVATARIAHGTADAAPGYARRFLALQLDALEPAPGRLPGRALSERQLELTLDALAQSRGARADGPG